MKKLLAILSVVLFANQASASDYTRYEGRFAELIVMFGDIISTRRIDDWYNNVEGLDRHGASYHVRLTADQIIEIYQYRDETALPKLKDWMTGIYVCEVTFHYTNNPTGVSS